MSGQEGLLVPPQQMPASGVPPQLRRSMSVDMPRPLSSAPMSSPTGLGPHFPPQGPPLQQHHILGQAFIELRHRVPEGRPRLPVAASPSPAMEAPSHPRHGNFMPRTDYAAPRHADPLRRPLPGLPGQPPVHPVLEPMPPAQQEPASPAHAASMTMRPLSHPLAAEFPEASLSAPSQQSEQSENLEIPPQPTDGLEEKLDADDPSVKELDVKDLEGVEVKDLDDEDLENLNLDTEDGKGDELDTLGNLEANDPHLDDLLRSGEFDIIAYTDPELDLGDKKGMFSEELDLHDPMDDKLDNPCVPVEAPAQAEHEDRAAVPPSPHSPWRKPAASSEIKTEVLSPASKVESKCEPEESKDSVGTPGSQASAHTDGNEGEKVPSPPQDTEPLENRTSGEAAACSSTAGGPGPSPLPTDHVMNPRSLTGSTPVLSSLLAAGEKLDVAEGRPLHSPPASVPASPASHGPSGQPPPLAAPPSLALDGAGNSAVPMAPRLKHSFPPGAVQVNPGFVPGPAPPAAHGFGAGKPPSQAVPLAGQPGSSTTVPGPQQLVVPQSLAPQSRERPLLLDEQPLLLQDLLDQERQEQQQQRQMQAMIRQQRTEPFFPNIGRHLRGGLTGAMGTQSCEGLAPRSGSRASF